LKIAAISIFILLGISLYLFQKINAQPLNLTIQQNLTQQRNLTQPLSAADQFRCIISPDQPTDPVEMNSNWFGARLNETRIIHTEKEIFQCASPVSSIPPPFKRDLYITSDVLGDPITRTFVSANVIPTVCDMSLQGNVNSCSFGWKLDVDATARDCMEDPIQHPLEMDTAVHPNNTFFTSTVISETHEYKCGQVGNPDKIKVVTIFNFVYDTTPLVITCIKDVPSALVESCSAELVPSDLAINNSKSYSPTPPSLD
jgi:hypothetical protein